MIYLSNLDIHIVFRHNKQHVLRPSKGWMVVGGTHVLPPGTRHPGTPSSLEIQTTMFIRCPAQCEAGSSVGKWAIITISWDHLS